MTLDQRHRLWRTAVLVQSGVIVSLLSANYHLTRTVDEAIRLLDADTEALRVDTQALRAAREALARCTALIDSAPIVPSVPNPPNLERVRPRAGEALPGGSRWDDPEATPAELSTWTNGRYSVSAIRRAIRSGELRAESAPGPKGRPRYFVHLGDWIAFLKRRRYDQPTRIAALENVARRLAS